MEISELIPIYALDLWNILLDARRLKGLEFELAVNNGLRRIGFRRLTRLKKGRNYIKGASGVIHEIDICSFEPNSSELLVGECKTGRLVRYRNVLNFIAKSQDVIDKLMKKVSPARITKS